ncbi:hypothetical protein V7S43_003270 [Phytophthora oleae]|uniref:Uncharacterized protein n=1 Tax=Phytophthora oleae TaxID=2107226 RepID=A0ABD3FWN5_9STRA
MKQSVCALMAQEVGKALSTVCCFTSRKTSPRDELKCIRGTKSQHPFRWGVSTIETDAEDDDGPGSGDEDVLTSLGASYRAWRVYHREKRAHDYTKSRLVDAIRGEAWLVKQVARVGGAVEGIECTLMKHEDLQAQYQENSYRLHEAEAAALHWKSQCQEVLPELAASNLEKQRLAEELRKVKKLALLAKSRQYLPPRHHESKKRAYSDINFV